MQNEMQNEIVYLYLDDIIPNRFQPREIFDDEALKELAISIKEHGVIQPIIVRQVNNKYEIIAGERRYKAATMAGLTKIPAIVKNLDDKESSKVALIENLQRKDLTPIEEARTYQKILELDNMTQEALAQTMGKTQSAVSNKLRLLALPDEVQDALLKEQISERHARSLLNISNKNDQIKMLDKIISTRMTVKELDKEIKMLSGTGSSESVDLTKVPSNFDILTNNVKEEVAPPTYVSNSNNNLDPTIVDIDKIRQNSVDINQPERPVADIAELMKVTVKEEPQKENDFKFIPGSIPNAKPINEQQSTTESSDSVNPALFGFGSSTPATNPAASLATPKADPIFEPLASFVNTSNNESNDTTESINNIFPNIELPSVTSEQTNSNMNVSSSNSLNLGSNSFLNQFGLNGQSNEVKSVQNAVADIKRVVHTIEESGFVINVQENDTGDKYQIVINIDKK